MPNETLFNMLQITILIYNTNMSFVNSVALQLFEKASKK